MALMHLHITMVLHELHECYIVTIIIFICVTNIVLVEAI